MSNALSESAIVREVAKVASRRIARKAMISLQRMKHTLSGDHSELKTTWDEICAQVQYEESFYWDAYDETVRQIVSHSVRELTNHERAAIWLQTQPGIDWECDEPKEREVDPVIDDDIIDYVTKEYVYFEAGRWSNQRIRDFIERSARRD
jgi:hypothetical protein